MGIAIRLCGGIAIVAFGLYAAITPFVAGAASPADCGAGYCFTTGELFSLLFAVVGGLFAALTGLLLLIAALRTHQGALGTGLSLLIFTTFAVAIVYGATDAFQSVLFTAPGAYFAPNDQLPWYFGAASLTFAIMLALAPLPALFFTPGPPQSRARPSAPPGGLGLRPPILPRLALTGLLLVGVSLVVLDRVAEHYAAAGVGPAWPLLGSALGYYAFWWAAWILLMGALLRQRPAFLS